MQKLSIRVLRCHFMNGRSLMRNMLMIALVFASSFISFSAVAGSWVANGRSYSFSSETIQPYYVSYENVCHGNIPGPSGSYMYGAGQHVSGPCPNDASTNWNLNFSVTGGQCRPNPSAVGGGYSCTDKNYAINGVKYNGALPSSCNVFGEYAVDTARTVNLVYFGNGNMPDDFYEETREFAREYRCM